ncbi:hypothetical protein Taro_032455 [Colocasia esculenta]|uniref:Retrotransposon gag domain-containing protein n=1 Tax=Colocasia esculenta TaxID=4460 RepID=A0A843W9H6_COLES|nr:hypothetical protein [Colocasia esculenta]
MDRWSRVRLHSSSLGGGLRRRARSSRHRSVSPSGSPDPWAAVPMFGFLVGAEGLGAGVITVVSEKKNMPPRTRSLARADRRLAPAVRAAWGPIAAGRSIAIGRATAAVAVVSAPAPASRQGEVVESVVPGSLAVPTVPTVPPVPSVPAVPADADRKSAIRTDGSRGATTTDPAGSTGSARGTPQWYGSTLKLQRQHPRTARRFWRDRDSDRAESWVHELERTFETMDSAVLHQITWVEFLVAFHGEFLPDYVFRERRDLFHELVQGDLTVGQYHQRFL